MNDFGKRAARQVMRDMPGTPDVVTLWNLAEPDHPAWITEGLGEVTFAEYQRRITDLSREFEQRGYRVALVSASVCDVLDTLAKHDLPNTADGRAAAIGLIYHAQQSPDTGAAT